MDNLSRMAVLATNAGMSYGQWMALQGDTKPDQTEQTETDFVASGWSRCEFCGKLFKLPTKRGRRFCEVYCQKQAYYAKRREHLREKMAIYREKKRKEAAQK